MDDQPVATNADLWYPVLAGIITRHRPNGGVGCTAGQYRVMIAELEATVAAHPEWIEPCWAMMVFGCLGHGIWECLQVAPDDDVLQSQWVNSFDQEEWEADRLRRGLPVPARVVAPDPPMSAEDARLYEWITTFRAIFEKHLPTWRYRAQASVYRAMIAEMSTAMAARPDWDEFDWKETLICTLGKGTWDWLQVAGDGDVLQEEFMVRFDLEQWVRTVG